MQGRYGVVFAVQIQSWLSITCVAVQSWCERYISHRLQILCVTVARSGFIPRYKAVLGAGAKAKTMTNLLILLSVLGFRAVIFFFFLDLSPFLMGYSISSSTRSISHYESKIVIWFNRELISFRNIWFKLLFVLPFFAHVKVIQLFFQIYLKTVKRSEILSLTDNNLDVVRFLCSVSNPGKLAGVRLGRKGKTWKWCSWTGFVYFKNKTVNYHLQGALAKPVSTYKIW